MATARKTILVIDDSSLVRLFYRSILEHAGFRIEEALNGLEALEKLLSEAADLLIVDVNMPRMDGITFLKTLRQKELPLASIPALITSTEAGPQDFDAGRGAGANFYLTKPLDEATLVEYCAMLTGRAP